MNSIDSTNSTNSVLDRFRATNALLEGHFVLSSGLHSPKYLQCALALQHPNDASDFGRAIANQVRTGGSGPTGTLAGSDARTDSDWVPVSVDTVASPAIGGLIIGFATAKALGVRFIWTERQDGNMTLRRGFDIAEKEKILVVEDVITTGGSTRECIAALEQNGGKVIAAASIIDRSNGAADVGVPRVSLVTLDVPSYQPEECPMCAEGIEAVKPGSRKS